MTRRYKGGLLVCAVTIVLVVVVGPRLTAQWGADGSSPVRATYEAWLAGDTQAITRTFPTADAFQAHRADLQRTLRDWVRTWQPSQAAFLLELSFVAFDRQWADAATLLGGTRDLVIGRRGPPGTNASEDAFERTFHRAAVTFFLSRQLLTVAHGYMDVLAGRVEATPSTTGQPRLVDPWMTFARAMANDITTAPGLRSAQEVGPVSDTLAIADDDDALRIVAESAATDYARVGDAPEVAAEAAVRLGLLLFRLGRSEDALTWLDRAERQGGDRAVQYWTALFRGRVLEARQAPMEAAAAYERAATLVPEAQTPAVALASLWQRHDRPAEARRWAARAIAAPGGLADPWFVYWRGDLRLAGDRLTALREVRP
jgi:tetratricopeptide (TPR) repeat protein